MKLLKLSNCLSASRRRLFFLSALIAGLGCALLPPALADYTTTVNPAASWGVWGGWGCSLAWWANQFGQRNDLADVLFTTNTVTLTTNTGSYSVPGLGMTVARYNVGGTSTVNAFGSVPNNPSTRPTFKMIQSYWLDWGSADPSSSSWNWNADANQRSMMQKAQARGTNTFEMFSNSPPWWMNYNSSTAGGANGADNLQSWNYRSFAVYLATVARYAQDHWGVTFQSVEPFNEPSGTWWIYPGNSEGCHLNLATQNTVLPYLRTELNNQGLNSMAIAASDENGYDAATSTWNSLSSATQGVIAQINTHGYQWDGRRDLLYSAAQNGRKGLWNSEYGEGDGSGMSLASNLNLDMRWLHPSVWCYWQPLDSGGWGLIQSNPGDNWIGAPNAKYYVLAQYSRHIRPGMSLIDGGEGNTIAAYDASGHRLVLVTTNYGAAQWINYDLSRFTTVSGSANGGISRWDTQTGGGDMHTFHQDTVLSGKTFRSYFPANTVQTFEIQNVYLDPVVSVPYRITPQNRPDLALDVSGFVNADNTPTDLWYANYGAGQQWLLDRQSDNSYIIRAFGGQNSVQVLDVSGGATADGSPVRTYHNNGLSPQRWNIVGDGSGWYRIIPATATGQTLDMGGGQSAGVGSYANLYHFTGTGNQLFRFDSATPPPLQVSSVAVPVITTSGATITWTTNITASDTVDYGPTSVYGSTKAGTGSMGSTFNHSVALSGLTSSAVYHYRVRSTDLNAQSAASADATFRVR